MLEHTPTKKNRLGASFCIYHHQIFNSSCCQYRPHWMCCNTSDWRSCHPYLQMEVCQIHFYCCTEESHIPRISFTMNHANLTLSTMKDPSFGWGNCMSQSLDNYLVVLGKPPLFLQLQSPRCRVHLLWFPSHHTYPECLLLMLCQHNMTMHIIVLSSLYFM